MADTRVGVYVGPGNVSGHGGFKAWLGKEVLYASDYVPYTNGWATDFDPSWLLDAWGPWVSAVPGRTLCLGVPLLENGYAGEFSKEAAGEFDPYFSELGQQLVQHGLGTTIIRLGYEANNPNIGPWQATDDPSGFVQAYRHIVGVLRAVPGSHFRFDWTAAVGVTPGLPLTSWSSFYPGDDVVDFIGLDVYDIDYGEPGMTPQARWQTIVDENMGLASQRQFAFAHGKPVSFPEWGLYSSTGQLSGGGGDDPYFVDKMANWFATNDTAYQVYFDDDWGGGILADFPTAQSRYKADFGPAT